ncbi:MAG: hypothetical protein LBF80_06235 [Spirochaetaceae bacterium]|jgi:hypothetical protein|nr:hypothetical protein [Spirochaetaceae bacterium]
MKGKEKMTNGLESMIGKKYVVRTYSAGVHIGTLDWIDEGNPKVCRLKDCTRIWSWDGPPSLSGVAEKGITGGKLHRHSEVTLTEAVEYLPITEAALATLKEFYK